MSTANRPPEPGRPTRSRAGRTHPRPPAFPGAARALAAIRASLHPTTTYERNLLYLNADIALQGIVAGGAAAYLSVFVVRLGASPMWVGLLASLPSLVMALLSIPAGQYVSRQRDLVAVVTRARAFFRFSYLFIALVPWLIPAYSPQAIVIIWSVAAVASAFANVAFTAAMAEAVPARERAGVISMRYAIHAVVTAATLPLTGWVLDVMPFPLGYQVVFFASFVAAMASTAVYARIELPDQPMRPVTPKRRHTFVERCRALPAAISGHAAFLNYLMSTSVFRLGLNLPAALFSIYWVSNLHLTDSQIAVVSVVHNAFSVVGYFYWGRLAKRRGHGPVLAASGLGLACYPLITAMSTSLAPIVLAAVLGGWFSAGITLAFFNVLLATCPPDRRSSFVSIDTGLAQAMAFAGPLLGSAMMGAIGIRQALIVAAGVRLIGGLLFILRRVQD